MSAISQHLAALERDGLVATRRESQTIYYSLASESAAKMLDALYEVFCAPDSAKPSPKLNKRKSK